MAQPRTGTLDDRVRLRLGGDEIFIAESYDVIEGIFATPSCFSLEIGTSQPVDKLFTSPNLAAPPQGPLYPKGTKFELYIGDDLQMVGRTEGYRVRGQATRIAIKGRDCLQALARAHSEDQRTFIDGTYKDLVKWALGASGIRNFVLHETNAANRQIKAGIPIKEINNSAPSDAIDPADASNPFFKSDTETTIGAVTAAEHSSRIAEPLLSFVRRHLDRAGLFLWAAAAENEFILAQPHAGQKASYRIVRKRGVGAEASNVVDVDFNDDATYRHGGCTVYGRAGRGRLAGRSKSIGSTADQEMINLSNFTSSGWAFQPVLYRDVNVQNREQAEFFAERKLAEERRNGWSLTYTISGHRLPTPDGDLFPVVTHDTVIQVEDNELGLKDNFYVESVRHMRAPHTLTEIRLMRLQDLVFATGGAD